MGRFTAIGLFLVGASQARLLPRNETSTPEPVPTSTETPTPPYPSGDPPEIFPTPIRDLPEDAFDCWESHVSWTSRSTVGQYDDEIEKTYITHPGFTSTSYISQVTYTPTIDTTLCDGVARVTGRKTQAYHGISSEYFISDPWSETVQPPRPTCTVGHQGTLCSRMWASEASIIDRISKAGYTTDYPLDDPPSMTEVLQPPCETLDTWTTTATPVTCSIDTEKLNLKVLYWPVQTAGNFCAPANVSQVTITPTPTIPGQPNTARYGDLVLTSPTVYHILETVQMQAYAGVSNGWSIYDNYGTLVEDVTVAQDPRATPISSAVSKCSRSCKHCRSKCTTWAEPFPLEDLATVPASKYRKLGLGQDLIYQAWYSPKYTFPQNIKTEEEQWEGCATLVTGAHVPTYLALPTEKYKDLNEIWTYTYTPTAETDVVSATPGSATSEQGPAITISV